MEASKGLIALTIVEDQEQMLFAGDAINGDTLPGNATLDYDRKTSTFAKIEPIM